MKSRFAFSALVFLVAMTMATGAFAQGVFTVSSGNQPRGRVNGHAELAGGISLAVTLDANGLDGSVIIDYGVPITNGATATGIATAEDNTDIEVNLCNETVASTGATPNVIVSDSTITLRLVGANCSTGDGIDVDGVRLSLVGSGQDNIIATVTSTGDVRLPSGSNQVSVINSIVDELTDDDVDVGKTLTLTRHTGVPDTGDAKEQFHLVIAENTVDSFEGVAINLEFSGIPDGADITLDAWVATKKEYSDKKVTTTDFRAADDAAMPAITVIDSNDQVSIGMGGSRTDDVDAEDNETTVFVTENIFMDAVAEGVNGTGGMLSPSTIDVVIVRGSINLGKDKKDLLPLTLDIQVTADVGPIGDEDDVAADGPPVFASDKTTAVTVIDSTSAQISMKVAYVLSEGGYDTGIAVSNMTKDQAGAVHFAFFMNGEELTYSTPDMVGPQSTMRILLSQLLTAAEHTGSFSGYMTITADFTAGDAGVFISDFAGFTSAVTVVTVPPK